MSSLQCPICKRMSVIDYNSDRTSMSYYECSYCGKFHIRFDTTEMFKNIPIPHYALSSYIREYNEYVYKLEKENALIVTDLDLSSVRMPGIDEKIDKFLKYIVSKQEFEGAEVIIPDDEMEKLAVLFYCKNKEEFNFLTEQIEDIGYCSFIRFTKTDNTTCHLTYEGIKYIYKFNKSNLESKQCFVAMSFDPKHTEIFDGGIKPAVEGLNDFIAYRVDRDNAHDDKIDNKIITEIKNSRFMVADFTGNRHNVYYEVGFAMGFKIPVIFTCDRNFFDKADEENIGDDKIKFDLRQYPFILFDNLKDLQDKLKDAINARII